MKLSKEELQTMIADAAKNAAEDAVAPLRDQRTNWMDSVRSGSRRTRYGIKEIEGEKNRGLGAARICRALAAAKGDPERAAQFAMRAQDDAWGDDLGDAVIKSLQAGDLSAGGFLVEPEFADGIIAFLYNKAKVRSAGPTILPMNNGSLTLPKHTGSATATYVGESEEIPTSEPTGGQIILTAKKLTALVPISNDLLRFDSGDAADRWVRNDLGRRIAVREDAAFIRDDGTENKPKGMRYWALAANVTASAGATAANVENDVEDLINGLELNNVGLDNVAIFMNPRSKNHLLNLRDANGNLIFPEIRGATPRIFDYPVFSTNNIPRNLGGGSNESEIYFVNMDDVIIAESSGLMLEVDSSASYNDGGGLVSAFQRDETLVRAITHHDFAVTHEESIAIKTGVTWGA